MVAERGDWLHSPFLIAYTSYRTGDRDSALINYLLAAERGYELGQANTAWLLDQGILLILVNLRLIWKRIDVLYFFVFDCR